MTTLTEIDQKILSFMRKAQGVSVSLRTPKQSRLVLNIPAYFAGGCLRDLLLGDGNFKDIDVFLTEGAFPPQLLYDLRNAPKLYILLIATGNELRIDINTYGNIPDVMRVGGGSLLATFEMEKEAFNPNNSLRNDFLSVRAGIFNFIVVPYKSMPTIAVRFPHSFSQVWMPTCPTTGVIRTTPLFDSSVASGIAVYNPELDPNNHFRMNKQYVFDRWPFEHVDNYPF